MSEQINKVLASTAQSFSTAEQKQARDNIGALAASASGIQSVNHDTNLTGSGTSSSPLGINIPITFTGGNGTGSHIEGKIYPTTWMMSGSSTGDSFLGTASKYTASATASMFGFNAHLVDSANIHKRQSLNEVGLQIVNGNSDPNYTGIYMINTGSHPYFRITEGTASSYIYRSSIDLWNSYSSFTGSTFTGASANNYITGNGTSGSPLGLSSRVEFINGASSCRVDDNGATVFNTSQGYTAWHYAAFVSLESNTATADLYANKLRMKDTGHTSYEFVDPSSIYRWNHPTYYCIIKTPGANTTQHVTTASYPTGLTANARLDILNLGPTAAGYNYVVYERNSQGATRTLSAGQSGTVWWDANASAWTTLGTANE